jgi:hypothetical protein
VIPPETVDFWSFVFATESWGDAIEEEELIKKWMKGNKRYLNYYYLFIRGKFPSLRNLICFQIKMEELYTRAYALSSIINV